MRGAKWVLFALALGMMAGAAAWLQEFRGRNLLGPAGVLVRPVPIYGEHNQIAATQSIVLPERVLNFSSQPGIIYDMELTGLPADTTYGRRFYGSESGDLKVQTSVVLMGTDHTSIHQPQYCLYAQGWNITRTERIALPMERPFCDIPAVKIIGTRQMRNGTLLSCLYVYWFVSGDKITDQEGSRLWSMWKTMLEKGKMERWAYISYFTTCAQGEEQATFGRLAKFIEASAPKFQLVTGNPPGPVAPMTAQK